MSPQAFDRRALTGLLDEVATELQGHNATGRLYLVGGSAIALGYDDTRVTHDVDARIDGNHGKVIDAVREVGRRHGLPSTWVNEQATPYMPRTADTKAISVFYHPNLEVKAASREHLLAMKLTAGRGVDLDDAQMLISQSRAPLSADHVASLISTLYGEDALTNQVADNIATINFEDRRLDPPAPGLGL